MSLPQDNSDSGGIMHLERLADFDWILVPCVAYMLVYTLFVVANFWALYMCFKFFYKNTRQNSINSFPPVSIIKPLAGMDPNLKSNLETFFTLKYPKYELLFCIGSDDDPSLNVVRDLIQAYPNVDVHIFTRAEDAGVNPKVNNMLQGYNAANYDIIWMVDANILVIPDTLKEMVSCMATDSEVGLVHQMPSWVSKPSLASAVNQAYFGCQHARFYMVLNSWKQVCASGMSFLTRKKILEELGGLKHFGQYLAEDFFLSRDIKWKGYKIVLSTLPCIQNPGVCSISSLASRLSRWVRLRITMVPLSICLEPFMESLVMGCLVALCFRHMFGLPFFICYASHLAFVLVSDCIIMSKLQNGPMLYWKQLLLGWCVRELLALPIFVRGVSSRTVRWKDRQFYLHYGGQVQETTAPSHRPILKV